MLITLAFSGHSRARCLRRLLDCLDVLLDTDHFVVIVFEVAILEEDHVMVSVGLDALLAECFSALVAGSLDFLQLVALCLAIGHVCLGRGRA